MTLLARRPRPPAPAEPGTALAEADRVGVTAGGAELLRDVTLAVHSGEVLAVVGPNGAGKSTLLGVLAGDRAPSSGTVRLCGEPLGHWSTVEAAQRRSVLPQQNTVAFPFTVAAVVRMGRSPWAGTDADDDEHVRAAMAATEIGALASRRYTSLSGGEQARAALARVLAQHTALLLLDEPTASLDLRHQEAVLRIARARATAGAGVLVVLHDLGLAAAYADRVAVLDGGRLVALGPPGDVCTAELLSDVYRHPVEVLPHPVTGKPLILPARE